MERLRQLWHAWKRVGQFIGDMLARVVLTLFYFTILVPFGIGVRLLADPLSLKTQPPRWLPGDFAEPAVEAARRLS